MCVRLLSRYPPLSFKPPLSSFTQNAGRRVHHKETHPEAAAFPVSQTQSPREEMSDRQGKQWYKPIV